MTSRSRFLPAALFALVTIAGVLLLVSPVIVQGNSGIRTFGMPDDWTHHHLVFSHPGSFADAVKNGSFERWYRVIGDPRYVMQLRRGRGASSSVIAAPGVFARLPVWPIWHIWRSRTPHKDWGMSLLANGTVGNAMYPAKYTFDVTASPDCINDYVAFTTGLTGSSSTPSIVVFDELYSTQGGNCLGNAANGTGPQVKWAYWMNDTGTGAVVTSPVLSGDGTKVAYVETSAGNGAILRILKWKPGATATVQGTLGAPSVPDTIMAAGTAWNTTNCPLANSCIESIAFNGTPQDATSAPFYDYTNDVIYAGDSAGVLHKFSGVFTGTPNEVTTGGWPITVHSGSALAGPVYDSVSKNIFVGDASGQLSYVQEVGSTTGTCGSGSPPCLGSTTQSLGGTIVDPPIVDSSNGTVFVFDGQISNTTAEVMQTNTALTSLGAVSFPNNVAVANGVANMHPGAFDNAYYSGAAGSGAGKLYVCAQDTSGAHEDYATLFRISFTAGAGVNTGISVMNSSADAGSFGLVNSNYEDCSPITEINNTAAGAEWLFWSVGNHSNEPTSSLCATTGAGCLLALNLTTLGATWPPTPGGAYWASSLTPAGPTYLNKLGGPINMAGTSGIVVDNVANTGTFPQASSIYFSFTGNSVAGATCNGTTGVGCAIKLTQSGLN